MNVAKPGGPAGANPVSPEGGANPAGDSKPGGPDKRFSDVLAGKYSTQNNPQASSQTQQAQQPFRAPILDDIPSRPGAPNGIGITRGSLSTQRTQRVHAPVRTLEVRGERAGNMRGPLSAPGVKESGQVGWRKMADDTFKSESRIDSLIKSAQGGKSFNASELMGLQIEVFRYSQTVEVISRTADKLVGAVKQTLGTQV